MGKLQLKDPDPDFGSIATKMSKFLKGGNRPPDFGPIFLFGKLQGHTAEILRWYSRLQNFS